MNSGVRVKMEETCVGTLPNWMEKEIDQLIGFAKKTSVKFQRTHNLSLTRVEKGI